MKYYSICIFIKKTMQMPFFSFFLCAFLSCNQNPQQNQEGKSPTILPIETIGAIPLPKGYKRIPSCGNDFVAFSRNIGLNKDRTVYLFNGVKKSNQTAQYAVLNIDIGDRDLQQCADAAMRLRAEFLFAQKRYSAIDFQFTNGFHCDFNSYANGFRVVFVGNNCKWVKQSTTNFSHKNLRNYLDIVFAYAGTKSLHSQMKSIPFSKMLPGNLLLQKREPYGHAVTVMDMAFNPQTNDTLYLLCQSYMPAQSIHILRNPSDEKLSPWYSINGNAVIETPEWTFTKKDLKKF